MSFRKIGILGLGLIGGSILKGLEGKKEVIDGDDILDRLDEIDALILAVPISAILEIGAKIKTKHPLVVFDVGSVKEVIAERFEEWTQGNLEFVATHPMAGKEMSGFANSEASLFQGATWVVTPHKKNTEKALKAVEEIATLLGAHPKRLDAKTHDQQVALISHMPYLLSKALLEFVTHEDPKSLEIAGPGFKSMTRLAKDNPALHAEIKVYNGDNIEVSLKKFIEFLNQI
ncbi:MAG: prephenate dehydrogenase [Verrucomicrobia bacterium]|nr:prephenate dehydrogenase [Verrucomicrobiota bacterium]